MPAPHLIIGATSAIGAAIARRLHLAGDPVHLTARRGTAIQLLAAELGARVSEVDATSEDDLAHAVTEADSGDGLSGLAYCPGSIILKPISRVTPEDMAQAYALNVTGAAMAAKHASTALKAGNGSIVFFSTIAASQGFANHAIVATAKAAVEALTRTLAAELAPHVRVNCIAPSLTDTPLASGLTSNPAVAHAIARLHPIPRLGTADDHAALAAFLLSRDAGWITGQVFAVDGGRSTVRVKG